MVFFFCKYALIGYYLTFYWLHYRRAVFEGPSLQENVVLAEIAHEGFDESFMLEVLEFCLSKNELGATMEQLRVCTKTLLWL